MKSIVAMSLAAFGCTALVMQEHERGRQQDVDEKAVVRARAFELINAEGAVVSRYAYQERGAADLTFYDKRKTVRLSLGMVAGEGPYLSVLDDQGSVRLALRQEDEDSFQIKVVGRNSARVVISDGAEGNSPSIEVIDAQDQRIWTSKK